MFIRHHVTANDRQKTEYTKNKQEHTGNKTTEITQTGIRKLKLRNCV